MFIESQTDRLLNFWDAEGLAWMQVRDDVWLRLNTYSYMCGPVNHPLRHPCSCWIIQLLLSSGTTPRSKFRKASSDGVVVGRQLACARGPGFDSRASKNLFFELGLGGSYVLHTSSRLSAGDASTGLFFTQRVYK